MAELHPRVIAAHERADQRGEAGYIDPFTGYFVMTAGNLKQRGYCCGNGCRHCPFEGSEKRKSPRRG